MTENHIDCFLDHQEACRKRHSFLSVPRRWTGETLLNRDCPVTEDGPPRRACWRRALHRFASGFAPTPWRDWAGWAIVIAHAARKASAGKQALRANLVDEILVHVAPYLLGGGVRLFDDLPDGVRLEKIRATDGPLATHLRYRVLR